MRSRRRHCGAMWQTTVAVLLNLLHAVVTLAPGAPRPPCSRRCPSVQHPKRMGTPARVRVHFARMKDVALASGLNLPGRVVEVGFEYATFRLRRNFHSLASVDLVVRVAGGMGWDDRHAPRRRTCSKRVSSCSLADPLCARTQHTRSLPFSLCTLARHRAAAYYT